MRSTAITLSLLCVATDAAACWESAAERYRVSPALLYAIARVESNLNPLAVGHNRNGSRDIGLMQINSTWLPQLAAYGIEEANLFDACTSIHVGAWILAHNIARYGNTWEAVGAYNAVSPHLREIYADKIRRSLPQSTRAATGVPAVRNTARNSQQPRADAAAFRR